MDATLKKTLSSEVIRYSQVWEDQEILREALAVRENDQVLSIASAGCNALALSLQQPQRIVALDISSAQLALTELKLKGIELLDYEEFLGLMGFRPFRQDYFDKVQSALSERARYYWQEHSAYLDQGLIHCGRLDQFFARWAKEHLQEFIEPNLIESFINGDRQAESTVLETISRVDFELDFKTYFSEDNIAAKGRDPAQFKFVTKHALEEGLLQRFRQQMQASQRSQNYYLEYVLSGDYRSPDRFPFYAKKPVFMALKNTVSKIELVCASLDTYLENQPDGFFDSANLSNVFEYMSEQETDALLSLLAKKIKAGGRVAYWNLFCPRRSSAQLSHLWQHETDLSQRLQVCDKNWFYTAFHVETRR